MSSGVTSEGADIMNYILYIYIIYAVRNEYPNNKTETSDYATAGVPYQSQHI